MTYFWFAIAQFLCLVSMYISGYFTSGSHTLHNFLSSVWTWLGALVYWLVTVILMFYYSWKDRKEERLWQEKMLQFQKEIEEQGKLFGIENNEFRQ